MERARRRTDVERQSVSAAKSGVFTGTHAVNPVNGRQLPIYVADYVLMDYGTGAIYGTPSHDQRDFDFARAHELPVIPVIQADRGATELPYEGDGTLINSGDYDGLSVEAAKRAIVADLARQGRARLAVNYRLRDWLISPQRYWGAPIPIVHCTDCGMVPVPEDELPVLLPHVERIEPAGDGRSPLALVPEFVRTTCPECEGPARRETDTMDGFACSSWYFLRFADPHYVDGPFNPDAVDYWLPVDLYVGGAEHAVMHLLYARFWTKVMYDAGLISFDEPFQTLKNQGIVLAPDGRRMSKSRGNVITPDEVVAKYGADTLRVYELFMAPFEQDVAWDTEGIRGVVRWLRDVWDIGLEGIEEPEGTKGPEESAGERASSASLHPGPRAPTHRLRQVTHRTIRKVTEDVEKFRFITAVAALMSFRNELKDARKAGLVGTPAWDEAIDVLLRLMAPLAPHIAEDLWTRLGRSYSVHQQPWPAWDPELAAEETFTLVIQVNGKIRDKIDVPVDITEEQATETALGSESVQRHLDGGKPERVIYVPGRLVNIVAR